MWKIQTSYGASFLWSSVTTQYLQSILPSLLIFKPHMSLLTHSIMGKQDINMWVEGLSLLHARIPCNAQHSACHGGWYTLPHTRPSGFLCPVSFFMKHLITTYNKKHAKNNKKRKQNIRTKYKYASHKNQHHWHQSFQIWLCTFCNVPPAFHYIIQFSSRNISWIPPDHCFQDQRIQLIVSITVKQHLNNF